MKAETPAEGILRTGEFGTCKFYEIQCDCHSPECTHHLSVEADDMHVSVSISTTLHTKWWQVNRWKQIWSILTKGYVDSEAYIVLTEQVALNYAETLKKAIKDVKMLREKRFNDGK